MASRIVVNPEPERPPFVATCESAVLSLSGLVTASTVYGQMQEHAALIEAAGVTVPLVDVRGAVLALTAQQFCNAMLKVGGSLQRPCSVLVNEFQYELMNKVADHLALNGVGMGAFLEQWEAEAFAKRETAVWWYFEVTRRDRERRASARGAQSA